MTVKQALKLKNKLVQDLNKLTEKLHNNNSVIEGNTRDYSAKELLAEMYIKIDELTTVKTKIHKANVSIYDKIFLLSELKSAVNKLKSLDCTNGFATDYYSRRSESQLSKTAEITTVERDNEIKFLESRIDQLQEELDYHNITTEID